MGVAGEALVALLVEGGLVWVAVLLACGRPVPALGLSAVRTRTARRGWSGWTLAVAASAGLMFAAAPGRWEPALTAGLGGFVVLTVGGCVALGVQLLRGSAGSRSVGTHVLGIAAFLVLVAGLAWFDVPYVGAALGVLAAAITVAVLGFAGRTTVLGPDRRSGPGLAPEPGRGVVSGAAGTGDAFPGERWVDRALLVQSVAGPAVVGASFVHGPLGMVLLVLATVALVGSMVLRARGVRMRTQSRSSTPPEEGTTGATS